MKHFTLNQSGAWVVLKVMQFWSVLPAPNKYPDFISKRGVAVPSYLEQGF